MWTRPICHRELSSFSAIDLTFLSSVFRNPKNVAIWMIWLRLTKSAGSAQNFSIPGPNSRQLIAFGILRPSLHSPSGAYLRQNSQTIICVQFSDGTDVRLHPFRRCQDAAVEDIDGLGFILVNVK